MNAGVEGFKWCVRLVRQDDGFAVANLSRSDFVYHKRLMMHETSAALSWRLCQPQRPRWKLRGLRVVKAVLPAAP